VKIKNGTTDSVAATMTEASVGAIGMILRGRTLERKDFCINGTKYKG
jgi:hypothetical protein